MDVCPISHRALPALDTSNQLSEIFDLDETNAACSLNLSKTLTTPPPLSNRDDPLLVSTPAASSILVTRKPEPTRRPPYATAAQLSGVENRLLEAISALTLQVQGLQAQLISKKKPVDADKSDLPQPPASKKRKQKQSTVFNWADEPTPKATPPQDAGPTSSFTVDKNLATASPSLSLKRPRQPPQVGRNEVVSAVQTIDSQLADVRRMKQQEHDRLTATEAPLAENNQPAPKMLFSQIVTKSKDPTPSMVTKSAAKRAQQQATRINEAPTNAASDNEHRSAQTNGDRDAAETSRKERLQARMNFLNHSNRLLFIGSSHYIGVRHYDVSEDATIIAVGGLCIPATHSVLAAGNEVFSNYKKVVIGLGTNDCAHHRRELNHVTESAANLLLVLRRRFPNATFRWILPFSSPMMKKRNSTPALIGNLLENASTRSKIELDILPNIDAESLSNDQWHDDTHIKRRICVPIMTNLLRDAFGLKLRQERQAVPIAKLTNATPARRGAGTSSPTGVHDAGRPLMRDFLQAIFDELKAGKGNG
jgi:hypothetical protein